MKLAAYCRVSTSQEQQLDSLQNQRLFFEGFAQKNGHTLVEIYADEGISGKQMGNRQAFLRMLRDAEHRLFEMVVVKDISRFSRNTVDFLNAIRYLRGLQIEVQFLSNNQTVLGNSEFMLTIFSALAQEESAGLSRRIRFGKQIGARRGRVPNLIYGYDRVDTFTLAVNEAEAQVVRRMFDCYTNGGQGARKIALDLNAEGIPGKKGGAWSPKTVRRILENPIYNGVLQNNKYETVDFLTGKQQRLPPAQILTHLRPELCILPPGVFERAQQVRKSRQTAPPTPSGETRPARYSGRHALSTLIRCAHCGYAFSRLRYTYKNTFIKWRCAGRNQYTTQFCCNAVVLDETVLLEALQRYFESQIADRNAFALWLLQSAAHAAAESGQGRINRLMNEQKRILRAAENCKRLCMDGLLSPTQLTEKLAQLEVLSQKVQSELAQNRVSCVAHPESLFSVAQWSGSMLRELIEQIAVYGDGRVQVQLRRLSEGACLFEGSNTCG